MPLEIQRSYQGKKNFLLEKKLVIQEDFYVDHEGVLPGHMKVINKGLSALSHLKPLSTHRSKLRLRPGNQYIYNYTFQTDNVGRRKPYPDKQNATHHLILTGGSFTFGSGVRTDRIFPSYLNATFNNYRVYISAMLGFAPNDLLDNLIMDGWLFDEINEKSGYAVYFYIEQHLERVFPTSNYIAFGKKYTARKSRYYLNHDGVLKYDNTFGSNWRYNILFNIGNSSFLKKINIKVPFSYKESSEGYRVATYVAILKKIELLLKRKVGTKKLIVVALQKDLVGDKILKAWSRQGGLAFDYSVYDLNTSTQGLYKIPLDGHPSEHGHWIYAELLKRDLSEILNIEN